MRYWKEFKPQRLPFLSSHMRRLWQWKLINMVKLTIIFSKCWMSWLKAKSKNLKKILKLRSLLKISRLWNNANSSLSYQINNSNSYLTLRLICSCKKISLFSNLMKNKNLYIWLLKVKSDNPTKKKENKFIAEQSIWIIFQVLPLC